jgi:hypothetical protein
MRIEVGDAKEWFGWCEGGGAGFAMSERNCFDAIALCKALRVVLWGGVAWGGGALATH